MLEATTGYEKKSSKVEDDLSLVLQILELLPITSNLSLLRVFKEIGKKPDACIQFSLRFDWHQGYIGVRIDQLIFV